MPLNLSKSMSPLEVCESCRNADYDLVDEVEGWKLRFCISHKLLGDDNAGGPWITL